MSIKSVPLWTQEKVLLDCLETRPLTSSPANLPTILSRQVSIAGREDVSIKCRCSCTKGSKVMGRSRNFPGLQLGKSIPNSHVCMYIYIYICCTVYRLPTRDENPRMFQTWCHQYIVFNSDNNFINIIATIISIFWATVRSMLSFAKMWPRAPGLNVERTLPRGRLSTCRMSYCATCLGGKHLHEPT